jgi:hypothetical protein
MWKWYKVLLKCSWVMHGVCHQWRVRICLTHTRTCILCGAVVWWKCASKCFQHQTPLSLPSNLANTLHGFYHKFLQFLVPSLKKARHSWYRSICFIYFFPGALQTSVFLPDSNPLYIFRSFQGRVIVMLILTCRLGPVPCFVVCRFGRSEAWHKGCLHIVIALAGSTVWQQVMVTLQRLVSDKIVGFHYTVFRIYELHF